MGWSLLVYCQLMGRIGSGVVTAGVLPVDGEDRQWGGHCWCIAS